MHQPALPLQCSNDIDFPPVTLSFLSPSSFGLCNVVLSTIRPTTPTFLCITPSRPQSIATDNNYDLRGDLNSRDALSRLISLSPAALHPPDPAIGIVEDGENNSLLAPKDAAPKCAEAPEINPQSVATGEKFDFKC